MTALRARELLGMAYRQWRLFLSSSHSIIIPILEPTAYLLIFGQVMVKIVPPVQYGGRPLDYTSFILPGILAIAAWHKGVHAGTPIYVDRMTGELETLFALPIRRWLILASNVGSVVLQTLLYTGTLLLVGSLLGTKLACGPARVLVAMCEVAVFTWFVGMVFCALSSVIVRQEMFNIVINALILPLVFTSSVFYPVEAAPHWLRAIALVNPINMASSALRSMMLQPDMAISAAFRSLALMVLLAAAASVVASHLFYRSVR